AATRARWYWAGANSEPSFHGWPLRPTAARPASWLASGSGLHEAALRKQTSRGISNSARWHGSSASVGAGQGLFMGVLARGARIARASVRLHGAVRTKGL